MKDWFEVSQFDRFMLLADTVEEALQELNSEDGMERASRKSSGDTSMQRLVLMRSLLVVCALSLAGCGAQTPHESTAASSQPLAPMIAEPCLVRVYNGNVEYVQMADAFSPNEKTTPLPGFRFIAVGFPIGAKQTVAVDDYQVEVKEPQLPFAVGGESRETPQFFYDPEDFAETVELSRANEETNRLEENADELPQLVAWGTPASILLLLYEVPDGATAVTLRHGNRTFQLQPDCGRIDGKP
jgi:hypothetical protein